MSYLIDDQFFVAIVDRPHQEPRWRLRLAVEDSELLDHRGAIVVCSEDLGFQNVVVVAVAMIQLLGVQ